MGSNYEKPTAEELKLLEEELKRISRRMNLLDNENLKKFLANKGIDFFEPLVRDNLKFILLISINIKIYNKRFQKITKNMDLKFFTELLELIQACYEKSVLNTNFLLKTFLKLPAINLIKKNTLNISAKTLMDVEILKLEDTYKSKNSINPSELIPILNGILNNVENKVSQLKAYPAQFKQMATSILNEIKNNYETSRYTVGLILGLIDLLMDNRRDSSFYFSEQNSPSNLYFPPKNRGVNCCWIQDYMNGKLCPDIAVKYSSFKNLFEGWFFPEVAPVRHHKGHAEKDLRQSMLDQGIYLIKVKTGKKELIKQYKLEDLEKLFDDSFSLNLLTKHTVARSFFKDDNSLVDYLAEPYGL